MKRIVMIIFSVIVTASVVIIPISAIDIPSPELKRICVMYSYPAAHVWSEIDAEYNVAGDLDTALTPDTKFISIVAPQFDNGSNKFERGYIYSYNIQMWFEPGSGQTFSVGNEESGSQILVSHTGLHIGSQGQSQIVNDKATVYYTSRTDGYNITTLNMRVVVPIANDQIINNYSRYWVVRIPTTFSGSCTVTECTLTGTRELDENSMQQAQLDALNGIREDVKTMDGNITSNIVDQGNATRDTIDKAAQDMQNEIKAANDRVMGVIGDGSTTKADENAALESAMSGYDSEEAALRDKVDQDQQEVLNGMGYGSVDDVMNDISGSGVFENDNAFFQIFNQVFEVIFSEFGVVLMAIGVILFICILLGVRVS